MSRWVTRGGIGIGIGILLAIAPVAKASELAADYQQWFSLRDPDRTSIRFVEGQQFLATHRDWPEEKTIRLRTETAAFTESPDRAIVTQFCTQHPPISGRGMIACARAGSGDAPAQAALIHQGWIQGDFSAEEEQRILAWYGREGLTKAEHLARVDRLLYEGKLGPAKRMMPLIPVERHAVLRVRMALLDGEKTAPRLVSSLSPALARDPGILFERIRWRSRNGDPDIAPLLLAAPKDAPYPALWWKYRLGVARDAIGKRNYATALSVTRHHGALAGEDLADALWLKGWLLLRHNDDPANAYKAFFALYTSVTTPVSKARAAYWAARAATKNGNADIAREWMQKAAQHPTVFYGQLAQSSLNPSAPLRLPSAIAASAGARKSFTGDARIAIARALDSTGDAKTRDAFLAAVARAGDPAQAQLTAALAAELGGMATGVEIAKIALREGVVLIDQGWPRIALPEGLPIEAALTLAITRQESEFDVSARSSANAQGLMQLLPSTARQVAHRLGMEFSPAMLTDPSTNLTLGSHYLGQVIDGFNGALILGIASYNAGPGNARKWLASLGPLPTSLEGRIDWIESIPFAETRNYVMRVLENMSVYRSRTNSDAPLLIEQDVMR